MADERCTLLLELADARVVLAAGARERGGIDPHARLLELEQNARQRQLELAVHGAEQGVLLERFGLGDARGDQRTHARAAPRGDALDVRLRHAPATAAR